ncbi:uncharacterized protein LOC113352365 [Papaver somniferum]|uniref:uncharacterized protein LOC113352365 n=1 Tax=Papaver somniferum TaxID=3469 RepID=UPI000E6F8C2F|nr:uncharacterized protein LOC113352365 [Papaver somniferum]
MYYKSPGPDGFTAEFYNKCWSTIKVDFMNMLNDFRKYGSLDWRLNVSFITLIPKKEDTCTPEDFRPLSLISSAYKILSKIEAEKSRNIFSVRLIWTKPLIMSTAILYSFNPTKGLRQGDPLSLYLFLLVVEILSKLMNEAVQKGQIYGFQVADEGTVIFHLQFAYDTLIFIDANVEEVQRLFIILSMFEVLTGIKLNLEKSTMVSVGADDVIDLMDKDSGCKTESLPIKYLGCQLRPSLETVQFGIQLWIE